MSLLAFPSFSMFLPGKQEYFRELANSSGLVGMSFLAKFDNSDNSAIERGEKPGNIFMSGRMQHAEQFRRSWSASSLMDAVGFAMGLGKNQGDFIKHMLIELLSEYDESAGTRLGHYGITVGSKQQKLELSAYECKVLFNLLTNPELSARSGDSIEVAQSVANWLCSMFRYEFAIVTDFAIGATCKDVDQFVSLLYFNADTNMWDSVARAGFITEALFQRNRHGQILSNIREIVQWWSVYQDHAKGPVYGDVLYADFCKSMKKVVIQAKAMLHEPIYFEEACDIQRSEQGRVHSAREWVGDFGTVAENCPRYNPAMAKLSNSMTGVTHTITYRMPIMFLDFISYDGLRFNFHKKLRQEGN